MTLTQQATAPGVVTDPGMSGPLGIGTYRVYVYDRGALDRIGEIAPIQTLTWQRVRDDISVANLTTAGFGPDCCDMLSELHCMRHELVIFRDGVRVWEGPLTRIAYQSDSVSIEAKDVMQYIYRRICREGYSDIYPHMQSIITRVSSLLITTLERDDPNVLQYLTRFDRSDDAKEARFLHPYQKTVWEEIDDMAANAGLDYTVVGRRIMYWDTHNVIGRLPVLNDGDFLDSPIITEYGMSLATFTAATDGYGNVGVAGGEDFYYGSVELLASSYSSSVPPADTEGGQFAAINKQRVAAEAHYNHAYTTYVAYPGLTPAEDDQLAAYEKERNTPGVTPHRQKQLDALIKPLLDRKTKKATLLTRLNHARTALNAAIDAMADAEKRWHDYLAGLRSQAQRLLMGRNPAPVIVRIPDNSQLNPMVDIGINELVPGTWIPLRSNSTCRYVTQWQKLDKVEVSVDSGSEAVSLTLSVAPNNGLDPSDLPTDQ
jgi:hypothetical protein